MCRLIYSPVNSTGATSSLWMDRSPGGDTLAGRWGGFEGRSGWGVEIEIGAREIEWRGDKGGKRKREANELWLSEWRDRLEGYWEGELLLFPARSADWGWFQGSLSFSRNTTNAPKRDRGEESQAELWTEYVLHKKICHNMAHFLTLKYFKPLGSLCSQIWWKSFIGHIYSSQLHLTPWSHITWFQVSHKETELSESLLLSSKCSAVFI